MTASVVQLTTEIVANYVAGNRLDSGELPDLIRSVFKSLSNIEAPEAEPEASVEKPTPAQIRRSIKPEGLVSFEDGKTYQTLKRHLGAYGMTLADYKAKWGLPTDYPSTAPSYSARRSEMAKAIGLGRKAETKPAKTAGRKPKAAK